MYLFHFFVFVSFGFGNDCLSNWCLVFNIKSVCKLKFEIYFTFNFHFTKATFAHLILLGIYLFWLAITHFQYFLQLYRLLLFWWLSQQRPTCQWQTNGIQLLRFQVGWFQSFCWRNFKNRIRIWFRREVYHFHRTFFS